MFFNEQGSSDSVLLSSPREGRKAMMNFQRINSLFANDFFQFNSLQAQEKSPSRELRRALQERVIGQHCYLAEEGLEPRELELLKRVFQLDAAQWNAYKAAWIRTLLRAEG
jgi:hypothetical protein